MQTFLIFFGFAIGFLGTLIGAGGGFIMMPVLLFLYPSENPELLSAISLAVIFLNAASGSVAYARSKRIDYKSGLIFTAASLPGAILGARATQVLSRNQFEPFLGAVLFLISIYLLWRTRSRQTPEIADGGWEVRPRDLVWGAVISMFVGALASFLGIGGGIIHVPALAYFLGFPVHIATATSHFILALTSLTATIVHWADGTLQPGLMRVACLAPGVIVGAQLGARASRRLHGKWIIRSLAIAICLVALRLIVKNL